MVMLQVFPASVSATDESLSLHYSRLVQTVIFSCIVPCLLLPLLERQDFPLMIYAGKFNL